MGFYCYNCGKEVSRSSKSCPSCGVRFKAVKCPSCGYTDEAEFFKSGCPRCGYLGSRDTSAPEIPKYKKSIFASIPQRILWTMSGLLLILLGIFFYLLIS